MQRFKNILYVSDGEFPEDAALARAVSLAVSNQAALSVMSVLAPVTGAIGLPPGGKLLSDVQGGLEDTERVRLQSLVAGKTTPEPITIEILTGKSFIEIIRAVLARQYDLVIKPAHDPDGLSRVFGSDDMHLLRKCPCPVWLLKPESNVRDENIRYENIRYENIVVAIDFDIGDEDNVTAGANPDLLKLASAIAVAETANLHVVHVWETPDPVLIRSWSDDPEADTRLYLEKERVLHESGMDMLASWLRELIGDVAFDYLAPGFHLLEGRPSVEIPKFATSMAADLVVMGTVARTGIPGFIIGNTAETVFNQLSCSLLAVKPPGFVSPVTAS